jgi:hypothetical protein
MKNNINININIEIESQIFLSHNIKTALYNVKYHNTELCDTYFYNWR